MPRNRSLPPHLEIRRARYYWRRRLPRSLRDWSGPSSGAPENANPSTSKKLFLCFSLRIHVLSDAKILARRLTEMSDLVFAESAEMTMAIAPETQAWMLESLARFEIAAFERARAFAGRRSPELAAHEVRREQALQATLREAMYLGNREVARQPLRHVAMRLGIELDENDADWVALAYEATKTLLDVSRERARRQQGVYEQPNVFFRRAVGAAESAVAPHGPIATDIMVAPAGFATNEISPAPAAPAEPAAEPVRAAPFDRGASDEPAAGRPAGRSGDVSASLHASTPPTQVVAPAGMDLPDGYDEESWRKARIAARPPQILVDRTLLSEASRAALEKPRGITISEAIELYFDLLSWGYRAPFSKHQKRKKAPEKLKSATVEARLCADHKGKRRLALDYWPAALADEPVDEIHVDDVNDALERFWGVPANHGKSGQDRGKYSLVELIEKADATKAQLDKDIETAEARGAGAEEIDRMRLRGHVARISATTYIKHGRVMRAVGEMLMDMRPIDQNPFSICVWGDKELINLKSAEGERKRQAWDDRINDLFGSTMRQQFNRTARWGQSNPPQSRVSRQPPRRKPKRDDASNLQCRYRSFSTDCLL